jgi:chromosomal replication initiator protein DnaA
MLGWRKDTRKENEPQPTAPETAAAGAGAPLSGGASRPNPSMAAPGAAPGIPKKRLGDMLFEEGQITKAQLDTAIEIKNQDGTFIGKALVDLGFIDQKTLQSFLVKQCKIPHISLLDYEINVELLKLISEKICLEYHLLPIDKLGRILTVAMVDPLDSDALEHVRAICPDLKVKPILCDWDHFITVTRRIFASSGPQMATAKSFGLAETKPQPEPPKPSSTPKEQVAVEAAVDALLQEAAAAAPKLKAKPPEKAAAPKPAEQRNTATLPDRPMQKIAPLGDAPLVPDLEDLKVSAVEPEPVRPAVSEKQAPVAKEPEPVGPAMTEPAVAAVPVEQLSSQVRAGIEQVMQRAVDGLAAQIKEAKAELQAPSVPSPQELSRMVHENVQEAVQQTLAPVLERMDADKAATVPSAQELAQAIGSSVREAVQGTVGSLAKELHEVVSLREPAQATSSPQELATILQEGIRGAMQEAVAAITLQANQSLAPTAQAPTGAELGDTIRASVQSAMTDVVAALTEHTRQFAAVARVETPPAPTARDVAEAVRSSVQEAMREVASVMADQTRQMAALVKDDGPSADELAEVLGASVRQSMQEALKAVGDNVVAAAQANGAPLQEALAIQAAQAAKATEEVHEALEAMRATVAAAQVAQDTRETRLTELIATMKPAPAPEAPKAGTIEQFPEGGRRKDDRYSSVTVLRHREQEAKEALLDSEALGHSDERVRAALEAETTLEQLTFNNYLVGKANAFTVALAKAVSENPGRDYNPFFLYGDVGTGKTHLINAIANHVQKTYRDHRVGYVSAGRFARRLMEALKDGELDSFRENYCHCDLLVFDDIQFLAGHDEVQEEFFHIFNALQLENRQIILAADKAPDKLGQLEKRLVSRFSGGIVASLVPPDWETRMQVLHLQARESLVDVPEEILALIATRVPNDIRKMSGCLRKVVAFAKLMDRELTCDLAGEILKHLGVEAA